MFNNDIFYFISHWADPMKAHPQGSGQREGRVFLLRIAVGAKNIAKLIGKLIYKHCTCLMYT